MRGLAVLAICASLFLLTAGCAKQPPLTRAEQMEVYREIEARYRTVLDGEVGPRHQCATGCGCKHE